MPTRITKGAGDAGLAIIVGLIVGLIAAQLFGTAPKQADAVPTFDHSNCQYPDRWTNPVDGCDNSDPAVPECIRASYSQESEKACIDAFVVQHQTPAEQVKPVDTAPATQCGGK